MKRIKEKLKRTAKYWRVTYMQVSASDRLSVRPVCGDHARVRVVGHPGALITGRQLQKGIRKQPSNNGTR